MSLCTCTWALSIHCSSSLFYFSFFLNIVSSSSSFFFSSSWTLPPLLLLLLLFYFCFLLCLFLVTFLVLIEHHFKQGYMRKFIQTHFFYFSTFSLPTKQKGGKLKFFLYSYFFILLPFSIFPLFHSSNQTNPKFWLTKCSLNLFFFFCFGEKNTKFMHIFLLDLIELHN